VLRAVRVGNRRVQIRASALEAFLPAGETPDHIHGLAAFDEARWSSRGVRLTEGPGQEARADLAEALDVLAVTQGTFAALLRAARSDPSPA
jgi:hypothetical protein